MIGRLSVAAFKHRSMARFVQTKCMRHDMYGMCRAFSEKIDKKHTNNRKHLSLEIVTTHAGLVKVNSYMPLVALGMFSFPALFIKSWIFKSLFIGISGLMSYSSNYFIQVELANQVTLMIYHPDTQIIDMYRNVGLIKKPMISSHVKNIQRVWVNSQGEYTIDIPASKTSTVSHSDPIRYMFTTIEHPGIIFVVHSNNESAILVKSKIVDVERFNMIVHGDYQSLQGIDAIDDVK